MDVIMEEDDDMDLEDTAPPVPTPVMPTTSLITTQLMNYRRDYG